MKRWSGNGARLRVVSCQNKIIPIPSPGLLLGMVEGVVEAVVAAAAVVVRSVWPVVGWVVFVVPSVVAA